MRNGLVFLPEKPMATPSKTPNRDARLSSPAKPTERPGTFQVIGGSPHHRAIPPVINEDGSIKTPASEVFVPPGQTFKCTGPEAEACRADGGNKFKEIL
jgi:hypothetical protein